MQLRIASTVLPEMKIDPPLGHTGLNGERRIGARSDRGDGVGDALRRAYDPSAGNVPADMQALLDRLNR